MVKNSAIDSPLYLLLLIISSVSNAQQDFVLQPMNTTVCAGSAATFTCVIAFATGVAPDPQWFRNDVVVTNSTVHTIISNHSAGLLGPVYISSTVTVSNIKTADDGAQYQCVASIFSNKATLNVPAPPNTNLQFNGICVKDFYASWTPASNEEGLSYNVILSGPNLMNNIVLNSTMNTSYNFTSGLLPNTTYTIYVVSELSLCPGIPSTKMVTTLAKEKGIPQSVLNPSSTEKTNTTITVEWDSAESSDCGPILLYNVTILYYYNMTMVNSATMFIPGTAERMVEFSNLTSNTFYTISVTAINRVGPGEAFTINVTTLTDEEEANNRATNNKSGDDGLSEGAIIGIVVAVVLPSGVVITVVIFIGYRKKHSKIDNGEKRTSKSHGSSSGKPLMSNELSTGTNMEYAELTLGASGAAPAADPTKVSYTEVKEHEPLGYVEVQHDPGTSDKPIQGAPQVEYKELLHQ